MLDEESALLGQGKTGTGSLMTSFVGALDIHQRDELLNMNGSNSSVGQSKSKGLSIDEIFGNIFVINFAGHDTTANTLAFSMLLLAANPEVQDWVADELQVITPCDSEKWDYHPLFSDLKRCRAVLVRIISLISIFLKADIYICIARDIEPLSTDNGSSKMERSASTNSPHWRVYYCHSTTNRSHAKSADRSDTPQVLARPAPMATLAMDLFCSRVSIRHKHPNLQRRVDNPHEEHIFPLVRRPTKLSGSQIRTG